MASDPASILRTALVDRYALEREIGRGGMGQVLLARDLRHDRRVALKILHPELAASLGRDRFLREIKLTAGLQHPHILPVLDSGEVAGGAGEAAVLWFTMPFVEGETLRTRLQRERRLSIEAAMSIAREIADGLGYAHSRGIVHRDIKPENILLAAGHALLADFGIARVSDESRPTLTETGMALGTPAYMSPEQAMGEPVDARSDVYSLGCVLYEMVAGEPPFTGPNARAILASRLTELPPPVRAAREDVPVHLERAIQKSLERLPADRFATATQLSQALARRSGPSAPEAGQSIAVLPFANLSSDPDNEYFADGMTDELITALSRIGSLHVVSRTSVFAFKGTQKDVRSIGRELGVRTVLEGSVRRAGRRLRVGVRLISVQDGFLAWSETFDRELEDVFAVQDEISRAVVGTLKVRLLGSPDVTLVRPATANLEAYTAYLKGRHFWNRRTEGSVRKGLEYFEQALERDAGYAQALAGIADSYAILGFYCDVAPEQAFPRAQRAAREALELDPRLAEAHPALAYVAMYHDWDWAVAEREFRRGIELNPGYATTHQWYGNFLCLMGRFDEGVASFERAVSLDPLSSLKVAAVGWGRYFAGDYQGGIEDCRRALELEPDLAVGHLWTGLCLEQNGRLPDAVEAFETGVRLSSRNSVALAGLGHALGTAGRPADARGILEELLTSEQHRYVSSYDIATVHLGLGEREAALTRLERAFAERTHWMALLRVDPRLNPLRDEARFAEVYRKMGFPD